MNHPAPNVPETDVADAACRAADGSVLLLDVREPEEWARGHAEHAVTVPLGGLNPASVPSDRPVLTVCLSGKRAAAAAARLAAAGHDVTNVTGGMSAWSAAGLPLVSDGPARPVVS